MPGKNYKILSVREEVTVRIQDRAKKEEKTISKLLNEMLDQREEEKETNTATKEDLNEAIKGLREDIKTKAYAGAKEAIDEAIVH